MKIDVAMETKNLTFPTAQSCHTYFRLISTLLTCQDCSVKLGNKQGELSSDSVRFGHQNSLSFLPVEVPHPHAVYLYFKFKLDIAKPREFEV